MAQYAQDTSVPVEKSRAEIETILSRYGADAFGYMYQGNVACVEFRARERHIRFIVPLPDKTDRKFKMTPSGRKSLSPEGQHKAWEQACRQRWRALALAIKAKLECVSSGISEFESEFLANIVDPRTNRTVGEVMRPQIAESYKAVEQGGKAKLLQLTGPKEQ